MVNILFMLTCRSYVSFVVENNALKFTDVSRLLFERQSVLSDLGFNVLEISQGNNNCIAV